MVEFPGVGRDGRAGALQLCSSSINGEARPWHGTGTARAGHGLAPPSVSHGTGRAGHVSQRLPLGSHRPTPPSVSHGRPWRGRSPLSELGGTHLAVALESAVGRVLRQEVEPHAGEPLAAAAVLEHQLQLGQTHLVWRRRPEAREEELAQRQHAPPAAAAAEAEGLVEGVGAVLAARGAYHLPGRAGGGGEG